MSITNHHHCSVHHHHDVASRLAEASAICEAKGSRFTELRQDIYRLILEANKPLGAYDLISALQEVRKQTGAKSNNIAPPTVYRSLEFLLAHGLIHQLNSLNAYVPCCHPRHLHVAAFLICETCHNVQECDNLPINEMIVFSQQHANFAVKKSTIELSGLCRRCQDDSCQDDGCQG